MKKTVLGFIVGIFLGFFIFLFFPNLNPAYADFNCTIDPASMSPNLSSVNPTVSFAIDGNGNFASGSNTTYNVAVNGTPIGEVGRYARPTIFQAVNGKIQISNFSVYKTGTYNVAVYLNGTTSNLCSNNPSFTIAGGSTPSGGNSCTITFTKPTPFNPKPSDYIAAMLTNLSGSLASDNGDAKYHTYIRLNNNSGSTVWDGCVTKNDFTNPGGFGFGYLTTGTYYLQVNDKCGGGFLFINGENQACYATFTVSPNGGGENSSGNPQNQAPPGPCANGANINGQCTEVNTALGAIGTNPTSLVESLFAIILSLSGGIALLLIIISGYRILISQGNPEAIKGAREQLTAAIVGLLFIIFSIVILEIIGVNILHLPGFGGTSITNSVMHPNNTGPGVQ